MRRAAAPRRSPACAMATRYSWRVIAGDRSAVRCSCRAARHRAGSRSISLQTRSSGERVSTPNRRMTASGNPQMSSVQMACALHSRAASITCASSGSGSWGRACRGSRNGNSPEGNSARKRSRTSIRRSAGICGRALRTLRIHSDSILTVQRGSNSLSSARCRSTCRTNALCHTHASMITRSGVDAAEVAAEAAASSPFPGSIAYRPLRIGRRFPCPAGGVATREFHSSREDGRVSSYSPSSCSMRSDSIACATLAACSARAYALKS